MSSLSSTEFRGPKIDYKVGSRELAIEKYRSSRYDITLEGIEGRFCLRKYSTKKYQAFPVIGFAPLIPAEFVILKIRQLAGQKNK